MRMYSANGPVSRTYRIFHFFTCCISSILLKTTPPPPSPSSSLGEEDKKPALYSRPPRILDRPAYLSPHAKIFLDIVRSVHHQFPLIPRLWFR